MCFDDVGKAVSSILLISLTCVCVGVQDVVGGRMGPDT